MSIRAQVDNGETAVRKRQVVRITRPDIIDLRVSFSYSRVALRSTEIQSRILARVNKDESFVIRATPAHGSRHIHDLVMAIPDGLTGEIAGNSTHDLQLTLIYGEGFGRQGLRFVLTRNMLKKYLSEYGIYSFHSGSASHKRPDDRKCIRLTREVASLPYHGAITDRGHHVLRPDTNRRMEIVWLRNKSQLRAT